MFCGLWMMLTDILFLSDKIRRWSDAWNSQLVVSNLCLMNFFLLGHHSCSCAVPIRSQGGIPGRPESSSRATQQPLRQTLLSVTGCAHRLFLRTVYEAYIVWSKLQMKWNDCQSSCDLIFSSLVFVASLWVESVSIMFDYCLKLQIVLNWDKTGYVRIVVLYVVQKAVSKLNFFYFEN